ncbi:MAG: cyclase family protein [Flavobacteriaceae bacterium]|nr:MAG: cyclase family protein [Flavobacteriaceae bacterium]
MRLEFKIDYKTYGFDSNSFEDISIPLKFNSEQPNAFGVPKATSKAFEYGPVSGDTRKGGSCNFEEIHLIPHCNGTHTECIGHITHHRYSIQKQLKDTFIPATLITIDPKQALSSEDSYRPDIKAGDHFITAGSLKQRLSSSSKSFLKALIIRTEPNALSKLHRSYSNERAAFFSLEAMKFISDLGVEHLLVDLPSVDRSNDEGKLSTHHIYWNMKQGSHEVSQDSYLYKSITEMIYVPDTIRDGNYLLNLQIASFVSDASPSRPLIFPIEELTQVLKD